jgi:hypothetical protein
MKRAAETLNTDEIARVAHAIWESEGRPDGRDHEHWMQAKQLVEAGEAEAEYPEAATGSPPREVQPGFEDVPPGIVPSMKKGADGELEEEPGGRFAQQVAELPEGRPAGRAGKRKARAAQEGQGAKDHTYVRPAGRKQMEVPPASWSKTDEEADESFPASDPPGNY